MRILSALGFTVLMFGCASGTSYLKDAQSLTAKSSPEVDGLLARNKSLTERAAKLPADKTGEVSGRLASNKTELDAIKTDIDGAPAKIETAEKAKDTAAAKSTSEMQQASSTTRIPAAKAELDKLETMIAELEAAPRKAPMAAMSKFAKTLPTGYSVLGNLNGIEAQLLAFIEDKTKVVDKTTWFDFDRLTFKTASAQLDMEQSKPQLVNIVEILKAYPQVKLKVGGYTDNVGKPADNMKLSTARAKNVTQNLVDLGVAAARLVPEGYGETNAECAANDTDECKQKNRRIAVRVTIK